MKTTRRIVLHLDNETRWHQAFGAHFQREHPDVEYVPVKTFADVEQRLTADTPGLIAGIISDVLVGRQNRFKNIAMFINFVRNRRPDLRIALCSNVSASQPAVAEILKSGVYFLEKSVRPDAVQTRAFVNSFRPLSNKARAPPSPVLDEDAEARLGSMYHLIPGLKSAEKSDRLTRRISADDALSVMAAFGKQVPLTNHHLIEALKAQLEQEDDYRSKQRLRKWITHFQNKLD